MASLFVKSHKCESNCTPIVHMGPEEVARHRRENIYAAEITTIWSIMLIMNNPSAHIHVVCDDCTRSIELIDAVQEQVSFLTKSQNMITLGSLKISQCNVTGRVQISDYIRIV